VAAANPNAVGGPFVLQDADGKEFTDASLNDGLALLTFGYTECTGACPRTMATFSSVDDALDSTPGGKPPLRFVFVSVDPARDQGKKLADYQAGAAVPLVALTGTPEQVEKVAATFGAAYQPQPKREDGSYSVRHSTDIYLVGPGGRIFKRFALNTDPDTIAAAVREYAPRVPRKAVAAAEGGER
jgi:protein SCO1/2